jgi:pimeloyl-ACP methyl ester carboxylesterase
MRKSLALIAMAALFSSQPIHAAPAGAVKNVVLVHGAFADGSGWRPLAEILEKDGYHVAVVQHPETSLADDVAAVKLVLHSQNGPSVLVGHSYGGAIITQAGDDPSVAALVYVAALAPDEGEVSGELHKKIPPASTAIKVIDNHLILDPEKFHEDFAADVPKATTHFMALSQVLTHVSAFSAKITNPAWKKKPSWGIVATEDRTINPELQRFMYKRAGFTGTEIKGSHAVFLSRPKEVAAVIENAAKGIK